jgi:predicted ester cyclase
MDTSKAKETYRSVIEAISQDSEDMLDDLLDPNIIDHNPIPNQEPGLAGFKQWMSIARNTFADFQGLVEDVVAEGDRVVGRVTWSGIHAGEFAGIPPTNKLVEFPAIHIVRLNEGKIVEWWGVADLLGLVQQLGAQIVPEVRSEIE